MRSRPVSAEGRLAAVGRRRKAVPPIGRSAALLLLLTFGAACGAHSPPDPFAPAIDAGLWVRERLASLSLEERVGQLLFLPVSGEYENASAPALRAVRAAVEARHAGGLIVHGGSPTETAAKLNMLQTQAAQPLLVVAAPPADAPSADALAATQDPVWAESVARILGREARAVGVHWLADLAGTDAGNGTFGHAPRHAAHFVEARERGLAAGGVLTAGPPLQRVEALPGAGPGESAVRALEGGAAALVVPAEQAAQVHAAIVGAVRTGRLPRQRLDAAVHRVLEAKARAGLHRRRLVPLDSVARIVGSVENGLLLGAATAASLTLVRDDAGVVPLDPRRTSALTVVVLGAGGAAAARSFEESLREIYGDVRLHVHHAGPGSALPEALVADVDAGSATILAVYPEAPVADAVLHDVARGLAARGRPLLLVSFGREAQAAAVPPAVAGAVLAAWQPAPAAQRAAARVVAGVAGVTGRTPADLPDVQRGTGVKRDAVDYRLASARAEEAGFDPQRLGRVEALLHEGILAGAAPGAALSVGRYGRLVLLSAAGSLDTRPGFDAATDSTIYDVASLTKVVATTTLAMMLVDRGRLDLDAPLSRYLAEWPVEGPKAAITIRHLLTHTSGLPAFAPLYRTLRGREAYLARIVGMTLVGPPGEQTLYSDFGPILLGFAIERISGRPLDVLFAEWVAGPLGLRETGFNPLDGAGTADDAGTAWDDPGGRGDAVLARIAPTEIDTVFRRVQLHGRVHDENAWAIGGVSGHAGLFSSARDLAVFAQFLLDRGFHDGRRLIHPATVEAFTARQDPASSRALGWDTPEGTSSAGDYFSARSFGHTGFTGTSLWIDPDRDLFVVLLTNRVNPTRENQAHVRLRRAIADAVQQAIVDVPVAPRPAGRPAGG
jgi:beta-N-acetylhexosaminidase